MLPADRRINHSREISAVVSSGVRAGSRLVVVHAAPARTPGTSRFAFAVGRSVGNSVTRHAVTRKLRSAVYEERSHWDALGEDVVVRALPASAMADSTQLRAGLQRCRASLAAKLAAGGAR